jgi:peptidylprolyl isomerase
MRRSLLDGRPTEGSPVKRLLALLLVPVCVLTVACGEGEEADTSDTSDTIDTTATTSGSSTTVNTGPTTTAGPVTAGVTVVSVSDDLEAKPEIDLEPADEAPTEVVIDDIVEGDGDAVHGGAQLEVQYVGLLTNGTEFDSSWSRGEPAQFGLDGVIEGWGEGLVGMKAGGRRSLVIPADKAYGEMGSGDTIPPGATLVFVVDLVSVTNIEANGVDVGSVSDDVGEEPTVEVTAADDAWVDGLVIEDVVVGDGAEVPADGDPRVKVHYMGLLRDGTEFDSSWSGEPVEFNLSQVIPGWDEGLRGMKAGGRRTLIIPPSLGYGPEGTSDGTIPPNAPLVFVVDLVEIVE